MLPFYVVLQIALAIALNPSITELIWMLTIPASIMLFVTVFGITVNLKFHSFDWEKEETVVKQSLPSFIGGFMGLFLSVILAVTLLLLPTHLGNFTKLIICLVLLLITAILYKSNNRKNLTEL